MSHAPLMRFLGLTEHSSDRSILGLSPEQVSSSQLIAKALDQRLADLDRHPGARTPAAAAVRRRLGEAAGRLMASLTVGSTKSDSPVMEPEEEVQRQHAVTPAPPPMIAEQLLQGSDVMDADVRDVEEEVVVENSEPVDTRTHPLQPGKGAVATLTEFDRTVLAILSDPVDGTQAVEGD